MINGFSAFTNIWDSRASRCVRSTSVIDRRVSRFISRVFGRQRERWKSSFDPEKTYDINSVTLDYQ